MTKVVKFVSKQPTAGQLRPIQIKLSWEDDESDHVTEWEPVNGLLMCGKWAQLSPNSHFLNGRKINNLFSRPAAHYFTVKMFNKLNKIKDPLLH